MFLNVVTDDAPVMAGESSFQTRGAATAKARSLIVDRLDCRTNSEAELQCRRPLRECTLKIRSSANQFHSSIHQTEFSVSKFSVPRGFYVRSSLRILDSGYMW